MKPIPIHPYDLAEILNSEAPPDYVDIYRKDGEETVFEFSKIQFVQSPKAPRLLHGIH